MTDDRQDDKPQFPMQRTPRDEAAAPAEEPAAAAPTPATPFPEIPGWTSPTPRDLTPDRATPVVEETVIEGPSADAQTTESGTRAPMGGPYVVTDTGAPVAEQAVVAYEREPIGGPYVTSSEPTPPESSSASAPVAPATATSASASAAPSAAALAGAAAPGAVAPVGALPYSQYQPVPQPVAPRPPAPKGNRGAGTLIALAGTVAFALVYAAASFVIITLNLAGAAGVAAFGSFLASAAFIVPVVVFAISLILIVLIVNRAGWWAYVLGGFLVAVLVYIAGIAGALVHVQAWTWQPQEQYDFVRSLTMDPLTLAGAIVAREVSIWTGAWIAARGRKVKAANAAARAEWDANPA